MNLRKSIKIALGIAVLANPVYSYPVPVMNSGEVLASYRDDFQKALKESDKTEQEAALGMAEILFNPGINSREGLEVFSGWVGAQDGVLGEDPFPLYHSFAAGMYTREMHAPKGYSIIGKIHKKDSIVYLIKGSLIVADINGTRVLKAPMMFESEAGLKRVAYILEDTIWTDIHKTDKTNIEEAEKEIFASSYEELDMIERNS